MRASSWLRQSGIIEANVKETLESTLDELITNSPRKVSKKSIQNLLKKMINRDKKFREISTAHAKIFMWFEESESSTKSESLEKPESPEKSNRLRRPERTNCLLRRRTKSEKIGKSAVFNKERVRTPDNNYNRSTSPPPVEQVISLPIDRQGAIVEYFYTFVEHELYRFLVDNEDIVSATVVEDFIANQNNQISADFRDADLLTMLNFIMEYIDIFLKGSVFHGKYKAKPFNLFRDFKENVRHKLAHGISDEKGRWSDLALQNFAYLSCHMVACIGK